MVIVTVVPNSARGLLEILALQNVVENITIL
jgi:hypothetical protein